MLHRLLLSRQVDLAVNLSDEIYRSQEGAGLEDVPGVLLG